MQIWVDADACPVVIRDILFRASERTRIPLTLVANQPVRVPALRWIKALQVAAGFDAADRHIIEQVHADDLVVTADIPLAAAVIERQALALNPRGMLYTEHNIRERLAMRNLMDELRSSGLASGGPAPLSQADRQAFARELDRWLARVKK